MNTTIVIWLVMFSPILLAVATLFINAIVVMTWNGTSYLIKQHNKKMKDKSISELIDECMPKRSRVYVVRHWQGFKRQTMHFELAEQAIEYHKYIGKGSISTEYVTIMQSLKLSRDFMWKGI